MKKEREGYTRSADGTEIYFRSEGEGFPIIACNGILCSTGYWEYLRPFFRDRCQVVTWDYRGHGKSDLPEDMQRHTMDDFDADLLAVQNELKIDKALLIGHSMGVQLILAARRVNLEPDGEVVGGRQHAVGAALVEKLALEGKHIRRRLLRHGGQLIGHFLVGQGGRGEFR